MCSIQLIDRMSRNNDLIDDKENRLQQAINYYHQHKGEKGYSIRFVADYFGVCDTTLLRRLAKKTQFRKGRPPALSKELEDLLAETIIHLTIWSGVYALEVLRELSKLVLSRLLYSRVRKL
jgi:transposase